ncbi:hypothetical protein BXZ70DRAFT_593515 [Cristinia sonorae]|uniref:Uncharacterized protein n=1 Tax=Cristinia sonorae TaxID=1940300 RepID=A0A8K0XSW9_9AGAR|nr:hypothetical protein BXZ70DRAFT_593515 [Cristinia sonorae]
MAHAACANIDTVAMRGRWHWLQVRLPTLFDTVSRVAQRQHQSSKSFSIVFPPATNWRSRIPMTTTSIFIAIICLCLFLAAAEPKQLRTRRFYGPPQQPSAAIDPDDRQGAIASYNAMPTHIPTPLSKGSYLTQTSRRDSSDSARMSTSSQYVDTEPHHCTVRSKDQ